MLNTLRTRYADWRRERRIRTLRLELSAAFGSRDQERVRALAHAMFAECDARSPGQNARMERAVVEKMDPHARAVFERSRAP